jgi:hypothetical protein
VATGIVNLPQFGPFVCRKSLPTKEFFVQQRRLTIKTLA